MAVNTRLDGDGDTHTHTRAERAPSSVTPYPFIPSWKNRSFAHIRAMLIDVLETFSGGRPFDSIWRLRSNQPF